MEIIRSGKKIPEGCAEARFMGKICRAVGNKYLITANLRGLQAQVRLLVAVVLAVVVFLEPQGLP